MEFVDDCRRVVAIYCTSVNRNHLTAWLRFVVDLSYKLFRQLCMRFRLTQRVARSVCSSRASCHCTVDSACARPIHSSQLAAKQSQQRVTFAFFGFNAVGLLFTLSLFSIIDQMAVNNNIAFLKIPFRSATANEVSPSVLSTT